MPQPNLISPVDCVIQPIDRVGSPPRMDDDLHEPVGNPARGSTVTISAQVSAGRFDAAEAGIGGTVPRSMGYLCVRQLDVDALGYIPRRGDRITLIGTKTVNYYVVEVTPRGHWGDVGGNTLLKLHFADREPTHRVGDQ